MLDQSEYTVIHALSRDSGFRVLTQASGPLWQFAWSTPNEIEIAELSWNTTKAGMEKLMETGILEEIFHLRPTQSAP